MSTAWLPNKSESNGFAGFARIRIILIFLLVMNTKITDHDYYSIRIRLGHRQVIRVQQYTAVEGLTPGPSPKERGEGCVV